MHNNAGYISKCATQLFWMLGIALIYTVIAGRPGSATQPDLQSAKTGDRPEITRLADEARAALQRHMEPPPSKITVISIQERDSSSIIREYLRENYDAAVDALIAEARTPDQQRAAEAALRQLVNTGRAELAEALFKASLERKLAEGESAKHEAAAAARHSVAFVELPQALAPFIDELGEWTERVSPLPWGVKARPAYARAAELDAANPWTWIALALLADTRNDLVRAIDNAEKAANSAGDPRAMIAAFDGLGLVHMKAGRPAEAEEAYSRALVLAREWSDSVPASDAASRYVAHCLSRLGDAQREQGRFDHAASAYREALAVRMRLAEAEPADDQRQVDLIASHMNLQALADKGDHKAFLNALRIHDALRARTPFEPFIDPLESGAIAQVLLWECLKFAGMLTLPIGLFMLARYRRVIIRWMKLAAAAGGNDSTVPTAPLASAPSDRSLIPLTFVDAVEVSPRARFRSAPIAGGVRSFRRAAWVYFAAGLAFASLGAVLELKLANTEIALPRLVLMVLAGVWPVLLTLALLWGPDRRRLTLLIAGYLAILLAFCTRTAFSSTPPIDIAGVIIAPFLQPLVVVAMKALPTLFLILFLNKSVRAVGPVLMLPFIILAVGGMASTVVFSTYVGNLLTRLLPFLAYGGWSPPVEMFGKTTWLLPLELDPRVNFPGVKNLVGMLAFLPLAWLAIRALSYLYDRKWFSEQSLVFDSIWLFATLMLCGGTVNSGGAAGWLGLIAFAVYKLVTWVGLHPLAAAANSRPPARLLMLRTFGFRRRTERFFDILGARWRYAGPIQLIAAPDIAGRSIGPEKFLDFLRGRLRHRFIVEPGDVDRSFAEVDNRPDPDGRHRVNEFFCGHDTWRPVVRRLMAESDIVVMDLRSFSAENQGCLYELQSLIDTVPIARVVLLTDKSTDAPFLQQTLSQCWQTMPPSSPNRGAAGTLTLLNTGGKDVAAAEMLLRIADSNLATPQSQHGGPLPAERHLQPVAGPWRTEEAPHRAH